MNKATRDIAETLGVTLEDAWIVQGIMGQDGLDFSQCDDLEFKTAALNARAGRRQALTE